MKIHSKCFFKDQAADHRFLESWAHKLGQLNNREYKRINVSTSLGNSVVWSINADSTSLPFLFVFPGFRTSSLFWDLDNGLKQLEEHYRIYLVETNGQPVLSDGNTPEIKELDYGHWAAEVITHFTTDRVNVAGASFGALVCLKLAIARPELVNQIILLNPGCFQAFSLSPKNLFYNLLPIISPSVKNVKKFLDKAVFHPDSHYLDNERMQMIVDFEVFALTRHVDKAQKPYPMTKAELNKVIAPVYLVVGEKDLLFPYKKTIKAAKESLKNLKKVVVIPGAGHGIETLREAGKLIKSFPLNE